MTIKKVNGQKCLKVSNNSEEECFVFSELSDPLNESQDLFVDNVVDHGLSSDQNSVKHKHDDDDNNSNGKNRCSKLAKIVEESGDTQGNQTTDIVTEGKDRDEEPNSMEEQVLDCTTEEIVKDNLQNDSEQEKDEDDSINLGEGTTTRDAGSDLGKETKEDHVSVEPLNCCMREENVHGKLERGVIVGRPNYEDEKDLFEDSLEYEQDDDDEGRPGFWVSQPIGASDLHTSTTNVEIHKDGKENEVFTENEAASIVEGKEEEKTDSEETDYERSASQTEFPSIVQQIAVKIVQIVKQA
ncbi:high mobility group nucleosome-binding domain-containing protein 5-like [Macrobrachium rosenbergii]|uniref:high mobility group nucleosome-binding domain-containing protein 5-like n=1 Tax=Macrobrachium rosenbergii TaxID=79674 RepID=UPI0034D6819C